MISHADPSLVGMEIAEFQTIEDFTNTSVAQINLGVIGKLRRPAVPFVSVFSAFPESVDYAEVPGDLHRGDRSHADLDNAWPLNPAFSRSESDGGTPFNKKLEIALQRAASSAPELRESIADVLAQNDFKQIAEVLSLYTSAEACPWWKTLGVAPLVENAALLLGDASSEVAWDVLTLLRDVEAARNEAELNRAMRSLPGKGNGAAMFAAMVTLGSGEARTINGSTPNMREDLETPEGLLQAYYKRAVHARSREDVEEQIDSLTYRFHGEEIARKVNAAVRTRWVAENELGFGRSRDAKPLEEEDFARILAPPTRALTAENEIALKRILADREEQARLDLAGTTGTQKKGTGDLEEVEVVKSFGRDICAFRKNIWEPIPPKELQAEYLKDLDKQETKARIESESENRQIKLKAIKALKEIAVIRPFAENLENFNRSRQPAYGTNPVFFEILTVQERESRNKEKQRRRKDHAVRKEMGKLEFQNSVSKKKRPIVVKLQANKRITEVDVETWYLLCEATTAKKGKVEQSKTFLDNPAANPLKKPLLLSAPNLIASERQEIEQSGGDRVYIVSSATERNKQRDTFRREFKKEFEPKRQMIDFKITPELRHLVRTMALIKHSKDKREPVLSEARRLGFQYGIAAGESREIVANIILQDELKARRCDTEYLTALNGIEQCLQAERSVPGEHVRAVIDEAEPWNRGVRTVGTFFGIEGKAAFQFVRGTGARTIIAYDIERDLQGCEPELGVRSEVHPNGTVQKIEGFSRRHEPPAAHPSHVNFSRLGG